MEHGHVAERDKILFFTWKLDDLALCIYILSSSTHTETVNIYFITLYCDYGFNEQE